MGTERTDMGCREAERLIARQADEKLDSAAAAILDDHLRRCASCRAALEDQRVVAGLLRSRPVDRLSPAFDARLAARLDDASGWFGLADWRAWTFRLAPLAAVLAVAAFLTSAQTSSAPAATVSIEEWTMSAAGSSSTASMLWDSEVTVDTLLESMLSGNAEASGGSDAR
jgi:hypothetical protein